MSVFRGKAVFPLFVAGVILLAAAAPVFSQVESVPNPLETDGRFIGDGAGVLGPAYAGLIEGICRRLKEATGTEIAVITVRSLGGLTSEDFAERLFKRFRIGEKGRDNGLLLLFALEDRAVRLEVGYGLEDVIPDALAGRLIDDHGMDHFAQGAHGRGLYAVAKAAAETIAAARGATLGLSDPQTWPDQPRPAASESEASRLAAAETRRRRVPPALILALAAVFLGSAGFRIRAAFRRFGRARSLAEKTRAARGGAGYIFFLWTAALGVLIILLAKKIPFLSLLSFGAAPVAAGGLWSAARRRMKKRVEGYRLACASCGSPMDLVPEDADEALLAAEEAAEELAGGMDYELWLCPRCGAREQFAVKLPKAGPCPQCKRRTLVRSVETLAAATTAQGGRERITDACRNPKCGYAKSWERNTARIVPAASSSGARGSSFHSSSFHGSSSSGRSSFGGGRSGGGGASRRF